MIKHSSACFVLLLSLFIYTSATAQNILHFSSPADLLFVKAGTLFSLDSLVLTPSADFSLSGANDISKSTAAIHSFPKPYIKRVYQFARPTPPFSGAVTFYYLNSELNGLAKSTLTLNTYTNSWNTYINGVIRDTVANYVTTANLSAVPFSELTLSGSTTAPLAFDFLLFNTRCDAGGTTTLRWTTSGELGSLRYAIESSVDAKNWKEAGSMRASGNQQSNYTFTDYTAPGSVRYYRISKYDLNGRRTLSATLRSSCAVSEVFNVYPNPVDSRAYISLSTSVATGATIRLYDDRGVLVRTREVRLVEGNNRSALDVSGLAAGIYTLTASWNGQQSTSKLVKQ